MTKRGRLIVFEGMDGAGKTSLARAIADEFDALQLSTPLEAVKPVRAVFDDQGGSVARQLYYLANVALASDLAQAAMAEGRDVVIDRYIVTTAAWDTLRPGALPVAPLLEQVVPADLTVFVDADDIVRRERMVRRGTLVSHDEQSLARAGELREAYAEWLEHPVAGRVTYVDTTRADVAASTMRVTEVLGG